MSKDMFMTNQAVGAVMMALQKSLMEQSDIVPTLKEFKFRLADDGLMVINPPMVKFNDEFEESLEDLTNPRGIDVVTEQPERE